MEIKSSIAFDNELNEISFFKSHGYMLPFVGERYRKGGVLHIGASYYFKLDDIDCVQQQEAKLVLDEWWDESQQAIERRNTFLGTNRQLKNGSDESEFGAWVNTRKIIEAFARNNYKERNRAVYREFLKAAYNKNSSKELVNTQGYAPFAYMNFFQKPAAYTRTESDSCSCGIVARVIEILRPKYIVITSVLAGREFGEHISSFPDCEILYCPHPSAFGSWKKQAAALREFFDGLRKSGVF